MIPTPEQVTAHAAKHPANQEPNCGLWIIWHPDLWPDLVGLTAREGRVWVMDGHDDKDDWLFDHDGNAFIPVDARGLPVTE